MGNKIKKYTKKRDKKYDPYKLIKKADRELRSKTDDLLKEAVEVDEGGNVKLDEAGQPVFKDSIQWETDGPQVMAIWNCHKAVLENKIVPPNDEDAVFDSMSLYAKEWRKTNKSYTIVVPINYFVGTWHILNHCRGYKLFEGDKKLEKAIDGLTMWFAQRIEMYHEVKRRERVQDEASPEEVLKVPHRKKQETKVLPFKK